MHFSGSARCSTLNSPADPVAVSRVMARDGDHAFVRVQRVSKRFGEVVALEEASVDISRGEILTLLGPSGSGKTTMLNLVAGFQITDSASIEIDGQAVMDMP